MPPLVTVRIPELLANTEPLSLDDQIPIWIAGTNKTRKTSLTDLRVLIETGGSGSTPLVYSGGKIYHTVTIGEQGDGLQTVLPIPALSGKTFTLRRDGADLKPGIDFNILAGGGMELLKPLDYLIEGQLYVFDVYELVGGSPGSVGSATFLNGKVLVNTNKLLSPVNDVNKVIQVRGGASSIVITLPDVSAVPANCVIPFESSIGNTKQNRITTSGGQYIYVNNVSYNSLYLGIGETIWIYPDVDGWYLLNDFGRIYQHIGKTEASYKVGLNEIPADGSLKLRADYPRLWEWVQGLGSSLVTEAVWNISTATVAGRTVNNPYRGCYSTGDGSTNFRVPNLLNMALRGLRSLSGTDSERQLNKPGGFQRNEIETHGHDIDFDWNGTDGLNNGKHLPGSNTGEYNGGGTHTTAIKSFGGSETRMDNIGIIWTIKV